MSGHTPGPWMHAPTHGDMAANSQHRAIVRVDKGSATLIAGIFSDVSGGDTAGLANARLIAAAPELLAALKTISAWEFPMIESRGEMVSYGTAYGSNGQRDYMLNIAREAIAKAEEK